MRINIFHYFFSSRKANEVLNRKLDQALNNQSLIIKTQHEMAKKQSELAADMRELAAKLVKIGTESTATLAKVTALEEQLANADDVSPELQQAFDDLKGQAQSVDDLVQDAVPAPPVEGEGDGGGSEEEPA